MGILSWWRPTPPPVPTWSDEKLGTLTWDEDEGGWVGKKEDLPFSISRIREKSATPAPGLVDYAGRVLGDPNWRVKHLEDAKQRAIDEFGEAYGPEIRALDYRYMSFYSRKTGPAIIANVGEGPQHRSWRIEFDGERCEGLGFDT
jgi:hypothetical protein